MRDAILELVGENCLTQKSGQLLYERIYPRLQAGQFVELDFTGVKRFLSTFFDYGIAQLLRDVEPEDFDRLLTASNLTPVGQQAYNRSIENAKRHYAFNLQLTPLFLYEVATDFMATISFEIHEDDLCSINVEASPNSTVGTQIVIDSTDGYLCLDIADNYFEALFKAMLVYQFKQPSKESDEKFVTRSIQALESVNGVNEHGHEIDIQQTGLFKAIISGLKSAVSDHEKITKEEIGSTAKRIYGQVEAVIHSEINA